MKRLLVTLLFIFCLVSWCSSSYAVGSWTSPVCTSTTVGGQTRIACSTTFTGDASTGSVPSMVFPLAQPYPAQMYLLCTETLAGATAPTSGWSFTVTDSMGVDLMIGNATSQSTTSTGVATMPSKWIPVMDTLTLTVSGNSVAGGTATIRLEFTAN